VASSAATSTTPRIAVCPRRRRTSAPRPTARPALLNQPNISSPSVPLLSAGGILARLRHQPFSGTPQGGPGGQPPGRGWVAAPSDATLSHPGPTGRTGAARALPQGASTVTVLLDLLAT